MTNVLTYHNDPALKERAVEAAKQHAEIDRLRAGTYGEMNKGFHGCSVGCDAYDITGHVVGIEPHAITSEYFGFPEWLEHLRDQIFEELPEDERNDFHVRLKAAVPVGVDLEPVRHKLAIRRLDRLIEAQMQVRGGDAADQVLSALRCVRSCHEAEIGQDRCNVDWSAAESAARSAAESAESAAAWSARSAARSAAWKAWSAAWSAARSARSARSAARSAAESAWSAAWKQEASDLIELLEAA